MDEDTQRLTKRQRRELRKQERQEEQQKSQRSQQQKRILTWVLALVVVVLGAWLLVTSGGESVTAADIDPTRGASDATIVIEEFSDFQCPACAAASIPLKQAIDEFPQQIQLVYNDFPLKSIHPNAQAAAEAAMCANDQGSFWEYHDVLFDRQELWADLGSPRETFLLYAQELELDQDAFATCIDEHTFKGAVDRDAAQGTQRRVSSTPSFFVNGELISGGQTVDDWRQIFAEQGVTQPILEADPATDENTADPDNTNSTVETDSGQ